jgi:hypothetical protein
MGLESGHLPLILLSRKSKNLVKEETMSRQSDQDNHANQLNPNNDAYWESRGNDERPDDWEEQAVKDENKSGEKQMPEPKQ